LADAWGCAKFAKPLLLGRWQLARAGWVDFNPADRQEPIRKYLAELFYENFCEADSHRMKGGKEGSR
jgi:hypothetical protein